MNELRRLFAYLAPYRLHLGIAVAALVCSAALGLVFPWIMQNLVDTVLSQRDLAQLNRITIFLLGIFILHSR